MSTDNVRFEREGAVAHITLNRPTVGNSLDLPTAQQLLQAAIECDEDDAIRCVVLSGTGKLFCAGGDVASFKQAGEKLSSFIKELTTYVHATVVRFARTEKPVVTAINGPAAGAGIGLAVVGDIALAAPEANFTLAYTAIGMSPDAGATWLLPRLIGTRRTQELYLRNRRLSAAEAAEMGLITRVASGPLAEESAALAQELANGATVAFGVTKRLLLQASDSSLEAQLEAESRGIAGLSRTSDGREGIAAFLEKRKASFTGRQ